MTKEISKELIAKVFAPHIGCEMVMPKSGRVAKLQGIEWNGQNLYLNDGEDYRDYEYFPFKLILSDLSDISDEDISTVWEICGMEPYVNDFSKEHFLNTFDPSKVSDLDNRFGQSIYLKVYDKLRELGYMLPAFGITDLFEAGIAVRKNKEV